MAQAYGIGPPDRAIAERGSYPAAKRAAASRTSCARARAGHRHVVAAPAQSVAEPGLQPQHRQQHIAQQPHDRRAPRQRPARGGVQAILGAEPDGDEQQGGQHLGQLQPPGGQHTTGQRREQPGEDLQRIDDWESRPPQPRPAQLARPDARQRAEAERLREGAIHQAHAQTLLAHDLGRGRILGEFRTQRMDAAGALQVDAPPEQRLALREAVAEAVGGELPAGLVAVQERAFQLGPQVGRARADRRRRDEPGAGRPGRKQPVDVVARQQYVAVGDDDPGVARRPPALDDVVELGVLRHAVVADQQARLDMRMLRDQPLHQRHDGVLRRPAAQQDFQLRIVELEGGAQRRLLVGVEPAHRPDDGDRRPSLGLTRGPRLGGAAAAPGRRQRCGYVDEQGCNGKRSGHMRQQLHAQHPQVHQHSQATLTGKLVFRLCDKGHGQWLRGRDVAPRSVSMGVRPVIRHQSYGGPSRMSTVESPTDRRSQVARTVNSLGLQIFVRHRFTMPAAMPHRSPRRAHSRNRAPGSRHPVPGTPGTGRSRPAVPPLRPGPGRGARRRQGTRGAAHR